MRTLGLRSRAYRSLGMLRRGPKHPAHIRALRQSHDALSEFVGSTIEPSFQAVKRVSLGGC
jgi:hypothetical protein